MKISANLVKGQVMPVEPKPIDYNPAITKILGKHINTDSLMETPSEHVYIFSISLSFNAVGKVDRVYFSEIMSENLKRLINTDEDLTATANSIDFKKEFANKLVIFPIVIKRFEDYKIDNPNEFLSGVVNLWPKLKLRDNSKQVVFKQAIIYGYGNEIKCYAISP
jgi:hypothetical protein